MEAELAIFTKQENLVAGPMDVINHSSALSRGDTLMSYRIERLLGQGGFGVTYLALDTNLEMQVAIKEYLPEQIASRAGNNSVRPKTDNQNEAFRWGLTRFIKEARTLAKFRHKNIVRVMAVFEENQTAYMVMEYERGQDLKTLLRQPESRTEAYLKRTVGPIIEGLSEVHSRGYIHRDIKPANLLIREDGTPVLLDFGSARQASSTNTQALTALVTVGYAPLEQYNESTNDHQGPWTDIYGLGAVLYYAITGSAPVDSALRGSALLNDRSDPLTPLVKLMPKGYSWEFLKAIDWALSFKVADRPQTLAQWRAKLLVEESDRTVIRPNTGPSNAVPMAPSIKKVAIAAQNKQSRSKGKNRANGSVAASGSDWKNSPPLRPVGQPLSQVHNQNRANNQSPARAAVHDWDISGVADLVPDREPVQRSRRNWPRLVFPVIGLCVVFLGWQTSSYWLPESKIVDNNSGLIGTTPNSNPLLSDTQTASNPTIGQSEQVRQAAALAEQQAAADADRIAATAEQAELTAIRNAELEAAAKAQAKRQAAREAAAQAAKIEAARVEADAKKAELAAIRKAEQEAEQAAAAKAEREAQAKRQAVLAAEREAAAEAARVEAAAKKAELAAIRKAEQEAAQAAAAKAEREAQAKRQAVQAAEREVAAEAARVEAAARKAELAAIRKAEQEAERAAAAKAKSEAQAKQQAALAAERAAADEAARIEAAARKAELATIRKAEQEAAAKAEREAQAKRQAELAAERTELAATLKAEQEAAAEREAQANKLAALAASSSGDATTGPTTADDSSPNSRAVRLISDVDINLVAMRFRELGNAIRSKDIDAVRTLARPTGGLRKFEYLTYVFNDFDTIEVSIQDLQANPQDQTIRATLRLDRLIRPDGSGVLPPANFREFPLRSVRQGEWSEVLW